MTQTHTAIPQTTALKMYDKVELMIKLWAKEKPLWAQVTSTE